MLGPQGQAALRSASCQVGRTRTNERVYLRCVGTASTVTAQRNTCNCVGKRPVASELIGYTRNKRVVMRMATNLINAFLLRVVVI
jgi:hypothetical protein